MQVSERLELVVVGLLAQQQARGGRGRAAAQQVVARVADEQHLLGRHVPRATDVQRGVGRRLHGLERAVQHGHKVATPLGRQRREKVLDRRAVVARHDGGAHASALQVLEQLDEPRLQRQLLAALELHLLDDLVRARTLLVGPAIDRRQDVLLGLQTQQPLHLGKVERRHRERAVHIEDHALQRVLGQYARPTRRHVAQHQRHHGYSTLNHARAVSCACSQQRDDDEATRLLVR